MGEARRAKRRVGGRSGRLGSGGWVGWGACRLVCWWRRRGPRRVEQSRAEAAVVNGGEADARAGPCGARGAAASSQQHRGAR